jgi:hypothetical protein
VAAFKDRIGFWSLPPTLRDAVLLCRTLQIPALWVDFLCIIQDDEEDVLREQARIYEVFSNAHLTILAKTPESCTTGFLGEQTFGSTSWQRRLGVQIPDELGDSGDSLVLRMEQETNAPKRHVCCLDEQANALQEEILANRRLTFTGEEMIWSCNGRAICECGHIETHEVESLATDVMRSLKERHPSPDHPLEAWRGLVENISGRRCQNGSGKFIAISAVANMLLQAGLNSRVVPAKDIENLVVKAASNGSHVPISGLTKLLLDVQDRGLGSYFAGLWAETFVTDLAWSVVGLARRQPVSSAPSWSWASVDGLIRYKYDSDSERELWRTYDLHLGVYTKVEEVICPPVLVSFPTGPLSYGHAVLTGPLVEVEYIEVSEDSALGCRSVSQRDSNSVEMSGMVRRWHAVIRNRHGNGCVVNLDIADSLPLVSLVRQAKDCKVDDARSPLGFRLRVATEPLYCLHLFSWEDRSYRVRDGRLLPGPSQPWFLILRKLNMTEPGSESGERYVRVGLGCWGEGSLSRCPEWLKPWLGDRFESTLFEGCGNKTVRII